jgi:hypothetical protein
MNKNKIKKLRLIVVTRKEKESSHERKTWRGCKSISIISLS